MRSQLPTFPAKKPVYSPFGCQNFPSSKVTPPKPHGVEKDFA